MNFQRASEDDEAQINIAPMVDMVFTLLAFFVLTAVFGHERDVPAGSDSPTDPAAPAQSADLPERIIIRLIPAADGLSVTIAVGQTVLGHNGFSGITAKLAQVNLPGTPVVIAADRRVRVEHVARAMDAALASPMKKVSLSELASGDPSP